MEEIELVKGIKKNKTLDNYFGKFKYFKIFETDKALESLLKQKPVFNKCRKNKPLSYIRDNCLFIDDTVKNNNYSDDLEVCRFAPGIRSAIKDDSFILGEFKNFTSGLPMIDDFVKIRYFDINATLVYEYVHFHPVKKKQADPGHKLSPFFN